ncbi:hypothetical protein K504DRAFT_436630 [Pleomassaria siparia CBS 279.74]|uniref:Uncharacterized protein n=1 Tax=Pleomassaria siparia CBS 279.74 TaxID=1314801 RepID=A0A6G1K3C0_9PLEO|nr:hypothetical protein K504DRAFT_436630 [Pleomassaria siparia CBS 279.74]
MSSQSHRLRHSLGDSWGDAEYESDRGASVHSASDVDSDDGCESDFSEQQDMATPLPNRTTRASSTKPQDTPVKIPASRTKSWHSQTPTTSPRSQPRSQPRSYQTSPGGEPIEPSFIMPSMYKSTNSLYNGSPINNSNLRTADAEQGPWYYINLLYANLVWPILRYIIDIMAIILTFAKPIVAAGLVTWLLVVAIMGITGFLQTALQTALTPICNIPGSAYIFDVCAYPTKSSSVPFPDFEGVFKVQDNFQSIIDASKDASTLPVDMKRSEGMIRDLRSVIKYSAVPSRNELEVEITSFIETVDEAVKQLTRYNSKTIHTMDRLASISSWTQKVVQGISDKEESRGIIPRLIGSAKPATLQQQVYDQFLYHVGTSKEAIESLISISEGLLALLANLDGRLSLIGDIANRDGTLVNKDRDALLSQLWTRLGGNSGQRKDLDRSLGLLNNVLTYRRDAGAHVSATLLKLHEMEAGLENLREDVAAPEALGWRDDVPLEFHLDSINRGVDRMKKIQGVGRALGGEALRKSLNGGDVGSRPALPGRPGEVPTVYAKDQ